MSQAADFIDLAYRVGELAHSRPERASEYAKASLDITEAALNALKVEHALASIAAANGENHDQEG